MGVKSEITAHLAQRVAAGLPEVWQAPLDEIRKNTHTHLALSQPLIDIYKVEHKTIAGPTSDLPIRIYRPSDKSDLPVLVFFHGGGWVLNFLDIYEPALRKVAKNGEFVIIAVQYQKAPEHPFPIPFEDCYATLEWVVNNSAELGINPTQIGVGGDSAGGNLASAVALKARDTGLINLAFQLLIYPCNEISMDYPSATEFAQGYGLSTKAMKWFWDKYLPNNKDHSNKYAVPFRADTLKGVAAAIVIAAEFDPLTDDARNYYSRLVADSVPAIYKEYAGQIHGFFNLGGVTADADLLYADIAIEINAILGRGK
ncbi:MAG: alpha/beta hydrolase [Actinobacteria bacterium]|jgi:acetyl esterase|nr:alpha/beta hydrolase [Actinomycetota bacterium]